MNINKKTLLIAISSFVFLIIISVLSFLYLHKNSTLNSTIADTNKSAQEAKKELEKEKINYDNYQKQLAVVYAKNIDNCQTLVEDDEINECLDAIAVQAARKDYCEKIKNDDKLKTACINSIDYMSISWGKDPNLCDSLTDTTLKENCYEEYFTKLNDLGQCNLVKIEARKKHCQDIVSNHLKTLTVVQKDSDKDGLPDDVEISFGTNPLKADTDGDSISDYDEINKYHTNPLVAGQ